MNSKGLVLFAVGLYACGGASLDEELDHPGADAAVHEASIADAAVVDSTVRLDAAPADADAAAEPSDVTVPAADAIADASSPDAIDASAPPVVDAAGDVEACVPLSASAACAAVVPDAAVLCGLIPPPACGRACGTVGDGCGGSIHCGEPCESPLQCLYCGEGGSSIGPLPPGVCALGCE